MTTMVDELYDRNYQAGREAMNEAIDGAFARLARAIGDTFAALHRVHFSAPWAPGERRKANR
jgi:hypothetical protein